MKKKIEKKSTLKLSTSKNNVNKTHKMAGDISNTYPSTPARACLSLRP
jgi:hypothetical protein